MAQLARRQRLSYGMAGLSMIIPDLMVMQWLLVRYVPAGENTPLVAPALFGVMVFLGRLTEGVTNPFVGHWSDNCRHRWGRRMPFLRLGILPFLAAFCLLYNPMGSGWITAVYAFMTIEAYFFLYAIVFTPYLALLPEISGEAKERVDLMTLQSVFMMLGTFCFAAIGIVLEYAGWWVTSLLATGAVALFFIPVVLLVRERHHTRSAAQEPLRLAHAIRLTLGNRPFRILVAATACYWFGLSGILALVPVWVKVYLGGSEGDVTTLMVPYLLMSLVFFFIYNHLAGKHGKFGLMLATFFGSGLVFATMPLIGWITAGSPFAQTALLMTLAGAPVAGFMVLPYVVLADVVDYDEQRTGRRREAMYFGVQGIIQKCAIGLSILAFTIIPYLGSADRVTPSVFGLKLMALLCATGCIVGGIIFLRYPIREGENGIVVLGDADND